MLVAVLLFRQNYVIVLLTSLDQKADIIDLAFRFYCAFLTVSLSPSTLIDAILF